MKYEHCFQFILFYIKYEMYLIIKFVYVILVWFPNNICILITFFLGHLKLEYEGNKKN